MKNLPVVLITGCSTGIGRASVEYLSTRGWHVIASARRLETIHDLARENVDTLELDVADESQCRRVVEAAIARKGQLDALVNNAGYSQAGPLAEVTLDEMRLQFETNLFGALHLAQLVIPQMRKQNAGRIINISSLVGRAAYPYGGLYCATKWAMESMSDTLRVELKPWRIRVIVVEPGGVATRFGSNATKFMQRFINDPTSAYSPYLKRGAVSLRQAFMVDSFGAPPLAVAHVIDRALTDRLPRSRYQATLDAWLGWPLLPFFPDTLKDYVLARMFGLHRKAEGRV